MGTSKGEAARQRIVAAAWDAVDAAGAEQLLAGVGVREVARRAGVSPSAVTYHFGTSADLADAMAVWLLEQVQAFPVLAVEHVLTSHAGNLADALRLVADLNWERLTSPSEQTFTRRLLRVYAATGSPGDGDRLAELLRTRYWNSFIPHLEELYDRVLERLGLRWVEPFDASVLARMGPGWLSIQWMVDPSVTPSYAELVVAVLSAATVPLDHHREIAELEAALPGIDALADPAPQERADIDETRRIAAAAAGLFATGCDDVTLTDVARAVDLPVRDVADRFGTVRRVAASAFARHVDAVQAAAERRSHVDPLVGAADLLCELARCARSDRACALALVTERIAAQAVAPQVAAIDDVRVVVPIGPVLFGLLERVVEASPDELYDLTALMVDTALTFTTGRPHAAPAAVAEMVLRLLPTTERR